MAFVAVVAVVAESAVAAWSASIACGAAPSRCRGVISLSHEAVPVPPIRTER
ncbi:MAG: hypothetical protein WD603_03745 [Patescibacteria group bacterium]